MIERDVHPDETGQKDLRKQESLDLILQGLTALLTSDREKQIEKDVFDITLDDIDNYLKQIDRNKDIDAQLLRFTDARIRNEEIFRDICNHLNVANAEYKEDEKIYFIESSDSIVTFIPINRTDNSTRFRIELWQNSPPFIQDMYEDPDKVPSLDSLDFVKLGQE
jgi:hypothetical protein